MTLHLSYGVSDFISNSYKWAKTNKQVHIDTISEWGVAADTQGRTDSGIGHANDPPANRQIGSRLSDHNGSRDWDFGWDFGFHFISINNPSPTYKHMLVSTMKRTWHKHKQRAALGIRQKNRVYSSMQIWLQAQILTQNEGKSLCTNVGWTL